MCAPLLALVESKCEKGIDPVLEARITSAIDDRQRAKDAVLGPRLFERMYPRLDKFRRVKARLDPRARMSSSLARRLRIVDA